MRVAMGAIVGVMVLGLVSTVRGQAAKGTQQDVGRLAKELGSNVELDQSAAEVGLSLLPLESFGLVEKASEDPSLNAMTAARLKAFVEREKPRVQARLRIKKEQAEIWKWNEQTALEGYEKAGKKDPKWDECPGPRKCPTWMI